MMWVVPVRCRASRVDVSSMPSALKLRAEVVTAACCGMFRDANSRNWLRQRHPICWIHGPSPTTFSDSGSALIRPTSRRDL